MVSDPNAEQNNTNDGKNTYKTLSPASQHHIRFSDQQ
jgi:hypothetical protein